MDLLPLGQNKKRRMEDMFENLDLDMIRKSLSLEDHSSYERIISTLYFEKKEVQKKIILKMGEGTLKNFSILEQIIEKKFKNYTEEIKA